MDELHAEYVKENARIKALKEMEELSMDRAIREILNANLPGIIDIVGNLGKTKIEYKTAIEVAAGNRLNHIVVKRMDDAVRAIKYLKERKLGRATFCHWIELRAERRIILMKMELLVELLI